MKRVDHVQHVRSGYFARRWHGEIPSSVLLWRDMVAIGTWIWLASDLMFFAALFAAYFNLRSITNAAAAHLPILKYGDSILR